MGRGLAVDGSRQGQDDLAHLAALGAGHQLVDPQRLGASPVQGRQQRAQHVVATAIRAAALQRPQSAHLLDDADQAAITALVGADGAGVADIQRATYGTGLHLLRRLGHGLGQRSEQLVAALEQGERRAPGRARAQTRQLGEQRDQPFDLGSGGGSQGQLRPGKPGRPPKGPAIAFIASAWAGSSLRLASAWAATSRSARISPSPALSKRSSMLTLTSAPEPCSTSLTMPAPATPSAVISASLAWASVSFCCMACACFISAPRSFIVAFPFASPAAIISSAAAPRERKIGAEMETRWLRTSPCSGPSMSAAAVLRWATW